MRHRRPPFAFIRPTILAALALALLALAGLSSADLATAQEPAAADSATQRTFVVAGPAEGHGEGAVHVFVHTDGETSEVGEEAGESHHAFRWSTGAPFRFTHGGPPEEGGFLGVGLSPMTPELRTHFGVPEDAGVLISKIVDDSPAAAAGIRVGDILTLLGDEEIGSPSQLSQAVRGREAGETVSLEVWRDGQPLRITATLAENEDERIRKVHKVMIRCEEGDEDCGLAVGDLDLGDFHGEMFDCGDGEECRVEVTCDGGDCTCVVNGESTDCAVLRLPHHGGE